MRRIVFSLIGIVLVLSLAVFLVRAQTPVRESEPDLQTLEEIVKASLEAPGGIWAGLSTTTIGEENVDGISIDLPQWKDINATWYVWGKELIGGGELWAVSADGGPVGAFYVIEPKTGVIYKIEIDFTYYDREINERVRLTITDDSTWGNWHADIKTIEE